MSAVVPAVHRTLFFTSLVFSAGHSRQHDWPRLTFLEEKVREFAQPAIVMAVSQGTRERFQSDLNVPKSKKTLIARTTKSL